MPTIYVETSVISYLAARPSRDVVVAGRQKITRDWWHQAKERNTLVASELVVEEVRAGNPDAARKRLAFLDGVKLLTTSAAVTHLAVVLLQEGAVPYKASSDATHLALAAVNRVDYLVTWNFKHIANPVKLSEIYRVFSAMDYGRTTICAPAALMEVPYG